MEEGTSVQYSSFQGDTRSDQATAPVALGPADGRPEVPAAGAEGPLPASPGPVPGDDPDDHGATA